MKITLSFILLLVGGFVSAQDAALAKIPKTGKTIEAFIPEGYDTVATATGDLNKDKLTDHVLVLKNKDEDRDEPPPAANVNNEGAIDSVLDNETRLLVILFKNASGYTLAGTSKSAILCKHCGGVFGDPFESLVIDKGVLSIHHYGGSAWRWSYTHKFRWQQNDFFLIGQTSHSFWNISFCEKLEDFAATDYKDENLVTGAYEHKKITEEDCKLLVNKKGKQKIKPLKKLSAFSIEE